MPFLKGNKIEFSIRLDPELYYMLNNTRDPATPISTFCSGIIANAVGYQI